MVPEQLRQHAGHEGREAAAEVRDERGEHGAHGAHLVRVRVRVRASLTLTLTLSPLAVIVVPVGDLEGNLHVGAHRRGRVRNAVHLCGAPCIRVRVRIGVS